MILIAEEDFLPAVAALGDVVRDVGDYDSRKPGHEACSRGEEGVSIKYRVPGIAPELANFCYAPSGVFSALIKYLSEKSRKPIEYMDNSPRPSP
jgi:hypothetical protein